MHMKPDYQSFRELANAAPGQFRVVHANRGSALLILTPHGGGIEPGTSEVVRAIAGDEFSYYCFEGIRLDGNEVLHITSTRFDEPQGCRMVAEAEHVLSIHGCGDRKDRLYIGGLDEQWIERFLAAYLAAGFPAERGRGHISGKSPRNLCNLGRRRKGVQFELSETMRRSMFRGLDYEGRKHKTARFTEFILTGRSVLLEV